jgi:hypothetical protein
VPVGSDEKFQPNLSARESLVKGHRDSIRGAARWRLHAIGARECGIAFHHI